MGKERLDFSIKIKVGSFIKLFLKLQYPSGLKMNIEVHKQAFLNLFEKYTSRVLLIKDTSLMNLGLLKKYSDYLALPIKERLAQRTLVDQNEIILFQMSIERYYRSLLNRDFYRNQRLQVK